VCVCLSRVPVCVLQYNKRMIYTYDREFFEKVTSDSSLYGFVASE